MIKVGDVYPITTIKYPDGAVLSVILDKHLQDYTQPVKMSSLQYQLRGQTRAIEGVYPSDVELWLNNQPNND